MTRRMKDPEFLRQQQADIYAPHIAPVNRLVDSLIEPAPPAGRGWMPYVAPLHGGVHARVLSILRDPGPKTRQDGGSGMICVENDDPTAAKMGELFTEAGIAYEDITPWNAYPWYINAAPTGPQVTQGVAPLKSLVELMPNLKVVLLQGGQAQAVWRKLAKGHPRFVASLRIRSVATFHPGNQALQTPNPEVRQQRIDRRKEAMKEVADALS
jgi:hypothetical protein